MHEYRTENGHVVQLQAVSVLMIEACRKAAESEMRERGLRLDPPTYIVAGVDGATAEFTHNVDPSTGEDTIAEEPDTSAREAARAAWDEYQRNQTALSTLQAHRLTNILVADGIVLSEADAAAYADGAWAARHASLGVPVPTGDIERYVHYVMTVLIPGGPETSRVLAMLMQLATTGSVDDKLVAAAEELFRRGTPRRAASAARRQARAVEA